MFETKGYKPLEKIINTKTKVKCVDSDGYLYFASYDMVRDKRTKKLDPFKKQNPFKAKNIRLKASKMQDNCIILTTDEEIMEFCGTNIKLTFVCPKCGEVYQKKWCHWLAQPYNKHFCKRCSAEIASENKVHTFEELNLLYQEHGYKLISNYQYYLNNGRSYARMACTDEEGYKYAINLNSLRSGNKGTNKYSSSNPFAIQNLQKFCDENNLGLKIKSIKPKDEGQDRQYFVVECRCGKEFKTEAYKITSFTKIQCKECSNKESSYEYRVRLWLENNNIPYIQEFRFDDCRDKYPLPFDFRCDFNNKMIMIEVDGPQHTYDTNWFDNISFEERQRKDKIKTDYCVKKSIFLLRIPFWNFYKDTYIKKLKETFFGAN